MRFRYHDAMEKPIIGLTGGIASGKSTVARMLARRGVAVVDADELAREVVAKGTDGLARIVAEFGADVLDADGSLDRAKLGSIVFSDANARTRLEAITHPLIAVAGMKAIASHREGPSPYVVYEAALLVETGRHKTFPALVVVTVSPGVQLERLIARNGLSMTDAEKRVASQMPMERKVAEATFVIRNDGDEAALEVEVARVHDAILERFGKEAR